MASRFAINNELEDRKWKYNLDNNFIVFVMLKSPEIRCVI